MGSSSSKTSGLLDVAKSNDMNSAPLPFIKYAQNAGDAILSFAGCLNSLATKMDKQAISYMTPKEKSTFEQLEAEKMKAVDNIKVFVLKEKMRFQLMQQEATLGSTMADLVRNVRPEAHCREIAQMQASLTELQTKYQHFKSELEENCRVDGRSQKSSYKFIAACIGGLTMIVGAVGAIAFLIIHFVPGINLVLTPLGWTCVGVFAASAVAGGTVMACSLRQDEIDRAMAYMSNLQSNLQKLKESMQMLEAEGTVIEETKQLEHFVRIAAALEERCGHIAKICDEVSKSTFCG